MARGRKGGTGASSGRRRGALGGGKRRESAKAARKPRGKRLLESPTRLRMLGWLAGQSDSRTQAEVARALSMSNAAAHYHLKRLEAEGPVRFRGTRPGPNGITEKLYSADPRSWESSAGTTDRDRSQFYLDYTLASIREMHREAAGLIRSDWEESRFIAGCYETYASDGDVRRLKARLARMLDEFHRRHRKARKGAAPVAITFGILPSKGAGWSGMQRVFDMMA